jgi:hypothetical protein
VTGRHSNQLSYARAKHREAVWRRFRGAPLPCQAMPSGQGEAGCRDMMVGGDGLEPPTLSV